MNIAIVGAGKWGSALFNAISENNSCVITSNTKRDMPNFVNIQDALKCDLIIFALASQHTRSWLKQNFKTYNNQKILVASKGIEADSGKFLNEIYSEFIPKHNIAYLSGPSFAIEVMQKLPCALVISSIDIQTAQVFANIFPEYIKTYTSNDIIGSEICGAYKNVLAIASGVCDGLKLGNNARASLISRGLVEMCRFGKFFGGHNDTFLGLSGAGDLFLTASSKLSRNYRVGLGLANGDTIDKITTDLGEVAEGIPTAFAIEKLAKENNIYTPIANEVKAMICGKNALNSTKDLLKKK